MKIAMVKQSMWKRAGAYGGLYIAVRIYNKGTIGIQ